MAISNMESLRTHLQSAIEIDETFRGLAKTESDFDQIRETEEFQAKTVVV